MSKSLIHKKGIPIIIIAFFIFAIIASLFWAFINIFFLQIGITIVGILLLCFIIRFFRRPFSRDLINNENYVLSPADGVVAAIETVEDKRFFKDKRIQVSVFMSIYNIHVNWYPISGEVIYAEYQKGKYLVARNPKSSLENEMFECVIKHSSGKEIMYRQIAGAVARRIVFYPEKGKKVQQSDESGIILFGSRLDVLLPVDAKTKLQIGQKVKGTFSVIAEI
jgi:phosphatidylserine decarboxylase